MAAPIRSNREPNWAARWAVALGLVALLALPAAIAATHFADRLELLDAAVAIPLALVSGIAALRLARHARARVQRTLGRVRGEAAAAVGRVFGALGVCLAITATISVGFYAVLAYLAD